MLNDPTAILTEMSFFSKFKFLQNQLNVSIENSKQRCYYKLTRKLASPATSLKTYWSILKTFLNNKKIPSIPPLFHENKFITNFKENSKLFHIFFCKPMHSIEQQQCLTL